MNFCIDKAKPNSLESIIESENITCHKDIINIAMNMSIRDIGHFCDYYCKKYGCKNCPVNFLKEPREFNNINCSNNLLKWIFKQMKDELEKENKKKRRW